MPWSGGEITADDLHTAAKATAGGKVAGDANEDTVNLARKLVPDDEKILAVFEPEGSSYRSAHFQKWCDTIICPVQTLAYCFCYLPCIVSDEIQGYDDSYFTVTDKSVYKQPQGSTGKKEGKVELQEIYDVFATNEMPTSLGIGKCCCPTDNVTIEVRRGHPLATFGAYKSRTGEHQGWQPPNSIVIFTPDAAEAAAVIRAAIKGGTRHRPAGMTSGTGWGALSEEKRAAAKTLGYTKKKWNKGVRVPADDKEWDKLSGDEREAATTLGYTKESWGAGSDDDAPAPAVKPNRMKRDGDASSIEDNDWSELTQEQRDAAQVLGYDQKKWDKNKKVAAEDKDWDELTRAEQAAARILGHTPKSWDSDSDMEA